MKIARIISLCSVFLLAVVGSAWSQSAPAHAFTNVTIHTATGEVIESGSILWRNGVIKKVGSDVQLPFDAYVIDGGDSLHIYPGFIDGMALWGSPGRPAVDTPDRPGQPGYKRAGIQPQRQPSKLIEAKNEIFKKAQKHGFTVAALGLKGEMLPGQVELFFIDGAQTSDLLYQSGVGLLAQFEEARGSAYPSTTMGVMASFRQLWYDAQALMTQQEYYAEASASYPAPGHDNVLEALFPVMKNQQPFFFEADSKEYIERILWLQDEFGFDWVLISGKEAFKQAEALKESDIPVLVSIDLPKKPKWKAEQEGEEEEKESEVEQEVTEEMRLFRQRQLEAYQANIENIKKLIEAGVQVGYASNGLKLSDFNKKIQLLHKEGGLNEAQILELLTQNTADILGVDDRLGTLETGKLAHFSVFTEPFLSEEAQVLYSISDGRLTEFNVKSKSESSKDEEEG